MIPLTPALSPQAGRGGTADSARGLVLAELRRVIARRRIHVSRRMRCWRARSFRPRGDRIIPRASDALARGDLETFGMPVDDSQASAERWLANQIPETIALARSPRAARSPRRRSVRASAGSVWALVRSEDAPAFIDAWRRDYLDRFPAHADLAQSLHHHARTGAHPAGRPGPKPAKPAPGWPLASGCV